MKRISIALAACGLLGGCVNMNTSISESNEVASRNNFNQQVKSAEPLLGAPIMDPEMSAAAVERYKTGQTKTDEGGGEAVSLPMLVQ